MARIRSFDEEEVLDKALAIFWRKGYNGTSIQDLVDGLGLNRSSIYHTYIDKHNLFILSIERYRDKTVRKAIEMINNARSAKAVIRKLFEQTIDEILADKNNKGCFMVNCAVEMAPHDKTVADIVNKNAQDMEQTFYYAIKKGQKSGEISSRQNAKSLASFVCNNINGIRVLSKSGADKKILDDIIKVVMSVLEP
jgi:TetR/AcrR family transcriptional repressor of nem operon